MKSTDISMIIIREIGLYRKRQIHILQTVLIFFKILTFTAQRVELCFEKNIETVIICNPIFNKREIGSTVI